MKKSPKDSCCNLTVTNVLKRHKTKACSGIFIDKSVQKYFAMIALGLEGSGNSMLK